jgi:hypothetical protein
LFNTWFSAWLITIKTNNIVEQRGLLNNCSVQSLKFLFKQLNELFNRLIRNTINCQRNPVTAPNFLFLSVVSSAFNERSSAHKGNLWVSFSLWVR